MTAIETKTYHVPLGASTVDLVVEERGEGQPFLLLHGGAGPQSMSRFAGLLAERHHARALTPTHPGFAKTARPDGLKSPKDLAELYAAFLKQLGLNGVTVVGNSVGGWIAAELALLATPQVSRIALVGGVGIEIAGHPVQDISKLTLDQVMSLSYYNPEPFRIDPTKMTEEQRVIAASNRTALQVYAPRNSDPTLLSRISKISLPVLVVSGEADRIVPSEYGRAWAKAIPGAEFQLLPRTGHVPQIETPELLLETVWSFGQGVPAAGPAV